MREMNVLNGMVLALLTCSAAYAQSTEKPATKGTETPDAKVLVNVDKAGLALQGYDPVAYFTLGKPTKGDPKYRSEFKGAIYQFVSDEHKAMFDKDPQKYEPQFGGYCGYAASINKTASVDVEFWEIIDGRLVLQHNKKAWDLWHKDVPGNLKKADANWPGLVEKEGKKR